MTLVQATLCGSFSSLIRGDLIVVAVSTLTRFSQGSVKTQYIPSEAKPNV